MMAWNEQSRTEVGGYWLIWLEKREVRVKNDDSDFSTE